MSSKKSNKSKKTNSEPKKEAEEPPPIEPVPEVVIEKVVDLRTISITIESTKNIIPLYPTSDIKFNIKYLDKEIGESQPIPVTDEERLDIQETFEIQIDVNSTRQIDLLASSPVYLTAFQSTGALDPSLYEQLTKNPEEIKSIEKVDSSFSFYEALTGEKAASKVHLVESKKSKRKDRKGSSEKRDNARSKSEVSRTSKKSKTSKELNVSVNKVDNQEFEKPIIKTETYGMCVLDLIPLFHGETSFSENVLLHPIKRSCQLLNTFKNHPQVTVTVRVKDNIPLVDVTNILNITIESICNVPNLMVLDMDCKICAMLPLQNSASSPTIFHNPKIVTTSPRTDVPKRWPGVHDVGYNANTTKYFIDSSFESIHNKSNIDITQGFSNDATRLEFNYLKRNILFKNGNNDFAAHIVTHRKLVLEIFVTTKSHVRRTKSSDIISDDIEATDYSKYKGSKSQSYLHLMAVLDVSSLLYPGVTKLRLAAPVLTFTYEEASKAGLEESFFIPKTKSDKELVAVTSKTKLDTGRKKKGEKNPGKSSKKDKASVVKEDHKLQSKLPPKPEEPPAVEPSVQVFDDQGHPCFIVVEIELLKPVFNKRDNDDLKSDLYKLQLEALNSPKIILNTKVSKDFYKQTINDIIEDINKNWMVYNEKRPLDSQQEDFISYLKKIGSYQAYLSAITTAATSVVTNKYNCVEKDFTSSKNYQNLISEVFTELLSEMHSVLNTLVCSGMKPLTDQNTLSCDEIFFYAKEALELKHLGLADRYFLERIILSEQENPDYWFDYAIFYMETNDLDTAFECVKTAISKNCNHKYALILFGALLTNKEKFQEAETCFLNAMIQNPKWLDGWCVLYLYYHHYGRPDGMDMALDMARKYSDSDAPNDYFYNFEDLAWSAKNVPQTMFFKAAVFLLKMRLYSWVELALAQEVTTPKHYGYVNYLLSVVSYYQKNYEHALNHISEAKEFQGGNFAILGTSGHILLALNRLNEANEEYSRVIESFNRPDDIHLVYLNSAYVLKETGDDQKARKLILTACKYHQSPYVWLTAGKLYYQQNDLLSAEECLTEANIKDNRNAEVWGYLTLINLKFNRPHEAEQCFQQAIKSGLGENELYNSIQEEFKKALGKF